MTEIVEEVQEEATTVAKNGLTTQETLILTKLSDGWPLSADDLDESFPDRTAGYGSFVSIEAFRDLEKRGYISLTSEGYVINTKGTLAVSKVFERAHRPMTILADGSRLMVAGILYRYDEPRMTVGEMMTVIEANASAELVIRHRGVLLEALSWLIHNELVHVFVDEGSEDSSTFYALTKLGECTLRLHRIWLKEAADFLA